MIQKKNMKKMQRNSTIAVEEINKPLNDKLEIKKTSNDK